MITFHDVSFQYEAEEEMALEQFFGTVSKGELILLLGASGCGKTTITRLINGLVPHFYEGTLSGEVQVKERLTGEVTIQSLADVVGSVFQDPRSQFFATDVTAEIAFSCENAGLPRADMHQRVARAAERLGITGLLERSIFELSSGEKQAVAIASVYAFAPEIIVMDEPSANLDPMATEKLREIIETLRSEGFTIILSEHRIHYLLDLADRILFIKEGRLAAEYGQKEFQALTNAAVNQMGLRSLRLEEIKVDYPNKVRPSENVALSIENVSIGYSAQAPVMQNLNMQIRQGEILGIVGHNGVGKSTLLETLCGLRKELTGRFVFRGKSLSVKQRIRETYLVMQDSDYQLFTESVASELYLENEKDPATAAKVSAILSEMDLEQFRERHPASLSGGQKQRLSIAVAYMKEASVICFDEPTSGLDYANMLRVRELFQKMAGEGKTIVVISHDYEFLLATCTNILCVQDDYKTEHFEVLEETKEHLNQVMQTR